MELSVLPTQRMDSIFPHKPMPYALSVALLAIFALAAPAARADGSATIVFQDLTDQLSASSTSTRASATCGTPGPEDCTLILSAPAGATFSGTTLPSVYIIGEANGNVSDTITTTGTSGTSITSITIKFSSDTAEGVPSRIGFCIAEPASCPDIQVTEDGTVQTAGTVKWFMPVDAGFCIAEPQSCANGIPGVTITDTIQFQSDTDPPVVPEPGTLLLLGTGLSTFAAIGSRLRNAVFPPNASSTSSVNGARHKTHGSD